jgi:hypothetical protein
MRSLVSPYLPHIIKAVTARVDAVFSKNTQDPFNVRFNHGLQSQVGKDVYKDGGVVDPLVWLVMNFDEDRGKDISVFADVVCNIIIAMPTDAKYTQEDRDNETILPRLVPIYDEFMNQLSQEKRLNNSLLNKIIHKRIIRPYWGGGDVNGPDTKNLFETFIDAIIIQNLQLKLKQNCP